MSRASAIEAIEKFLRDWAADGPIMTFRSAADAVVLELAEHGFVSLDDVAEGWEVLSGDKEVCPLQEIPECDIDTPASVEYCGCYARFDNDICFWIESRPATIQEVLDGKAEKEG